MPLGPTEARTYVCVDPVTGVETGHEKFRSALHVKARDLAGDIHRDYQLACPTCGSKSVRPHPFSGAEAP